MGKRMAIPKKLRFEIFKRDRFKCQYCGNQAPDIKLEVDHITPVAADGDNDILNLITSCKGCNSGKGARLLDDAAVVEKRKAQLDELQDRREQLDMLLEWHKELEGIGEEEVNKLSAYLDERMPGSSINETGRDTIRGWLKKYSFEEILPAIDAAVSQYIEISQEGITDLDSANKAMDYVSRIASTNRRMEGKPYLRDLYYIRGIVRNRMYCNDWQAMQLLEEAHLAGMEIGDLKIWAIEARNWSDWKAGLEEWISG